MSILEALILGIVQGLTEFLPVSSTAHIRIVPALLGWSDPGAAFTAVIQLGTLLAVLAYFRSDLSIAVGGWVKSLWNRDSANSQEARLGWAVFYGTIPVVICGLVFKSQIEHDLRSLYVIASALIGLALLLGIAEIAAKHRRKMDSVTPVDGIIVGLWQALALIPGVSRSGSTITGSLFLGFDRQSAARFSFLLSVPAILFSGLFELYKERELLLSAGVGAVVVATAASFVVGYLSIEFLLRLLRSRSTALFICYRIVLGVALLMMLANGRLTP
jgi:undecaprenyl-diphosphatase